MFTSIYIIFLIAEIQIEIVEGLQDLTVIKENTASFTVETNYDNIPHTWYKSKFTAHFFHGLVSCIFILLSRESDQCAIRARLGVASHLSTTPRWGNPAKCLSQRHNK